MLRHLQQPASRLNGGTNRDLLTEAAIEKDAEWHSRRLGKRAIEASNASWKHDDLMREVRLAYGAAKRDALARLAALIASYDDKPSRFRSVAVSGAVAGAVLCGLAFVTFPGPIAAAPLPPEVPVLSPADAAKMRQLIITLREIFSDLAACPVTAEPIHFASPR